MLNRRELIRKSTIAAGVSSVLGSQNLFAKNNTNQTSDSGPKRIVFFLQNNGFQPDTCIPEQLRNNGGSLSGVKLPEDINPLEPYKDRMNIITGIHGRHATPTHSAYFGALGGYPGGSNRPPRGETIDYTMSKVLPQVDMPHMRVGMGALADMVAQPTVANLSASGAGKPLFMHCNPVLLYETIFGGASAGVLKKRYEAKSRILKNVEKIASLGGTKLPATEAAKYKRYVNGFDDVNNLRDKLVRNAASLKKFMPEYTDKYTAPEYETDWHEGLLDIGIATLKAGLSNTLTIASGRGDIYGTWLGAGVKKGGHFLGHMKQAGNSTWLGIRQYNCQMMVKIIQELESVPEGNGTMMDNTLIVYTSNNADKQHTRGNEWPFILLGNFGSKLKTGFYHKFDGKRPINDLYNTFLYAAGEERDHYNFHTLPPAEYGSVPGPIKDLLV
ncbi:MAG: DUF1552 domain-containing protein [Lentisphaerales bacterium]|nr:DUF1552 domain-containing protein [Lentisphaerales bacterium]